MIELVSILAAAAIGGLFASLLGQPILLGYLLAGVIIGPFGLGLIQEYEQVETLAELGVTFLLFTLGVEFSFAELQKVKNVSLGGGGLQILLTIVMTVLVSLGMGWVTSPSQGIFLGEILALSSTAVIIKGLMERNETGTLHGQVMLGILIVQDLALGLMLAVLPALNKPVEEISIAIGLALVKIALFALAAVLVAKWVIPSFLRLLARTESRELFLLGVVTLCLLIALLTGQLGLSTEMGAFVAGLMISEVEYADQTLNYVEPLRDVFAALFFAAIGVLINPVFLWNNLPVILGLVTLVLVGKFLIITPLVAMFRYPLKTALIAGLGLAQIGEFSFVLVREGSKFGLISQTVYLLILGTTAVTLVVTPFVLRSLPVLLVRAESLPWLQPWLAKADVPQEIAADLPWQNHIVICGYGRVGSNIVQLLRDRNYPVLVIDESEERIQKLREAKIPYIYGNAASYQVLEKAGVNQAKGMAIALSDPMSTRLATQRALKLNPELDLVVRANQAQDIELLYQLGAKEVVQPEFEASLELSTHLFTVLGFPLAGTQQNMQQIRQSHYLTLRPERSEEQVAREIQEATRTMQSRWYTVPSNSPLIGKTIEKNYIRSLTGVILMAITRASGEKIDYPEAETMIHPGDNFLLVGEAEELAVFDKLAQGEIPQLPLENDSFLWVSIPEDSTIVGQTLAAVNFGQEFGISTQAIRRQGKYIRFPDQTNEIKTGDQLLLFGSLESLKQVSQAIASAKRTATTEV